MMTTPTATARNGIYQLLNTAFSGTATVHKYFPEEGAKPKSVTIQQVGAVDQIFGVSEYDGSNKSIFVRSRFQINVFAETAEKRDEWSDLVIETLWDNRSALKSTYSILQHRLTSSFDMAIEPYTKNLYQKVLVFDVMIKTSSD